MSHKTAILLLLAISVATHFAFFGHPNETVFDEVHFGKFISAYYTHEYYFDIHPPLGKLIIAGVAKLADFKPGFSFSQIGESFPDNTYRALRFLPSLAGAFLPLIIFLLALELRFSKTASFAAGTFVALENALLVQSRFALLDAFLLLFGFLALYFYFRYRNGKDNTNFIWMGIFAGLSASIKWTGLSFIALAGIIELISLIRQRSSLGSWLKTAGFFVLLPFLIYLSVFTIHFSLLDHSGDGDAFMTPEFRKTLVGSADYDDPDIQPLSMFEKFTELNKEMYGANQRLDATHPYSSQWFQWPFMTRPIYYWNSADSSSRIYLLGNPVIWWSSTVAVLLVTLSVIVRQKYLIHDTKYLILFSGYALNLLPFIGVKRVMFLYHYFIPLIFAILMLVYLIDRSRHRKQLFIALGIASLVAFLFFAPLTYGLKLSPDAYNLRVWFGSWQ